MRILALGGLAGPVWFAAVVALCAALRPDYRHAHQFISELGAAGSPHAWLMNYAGFLPVGLLLGIGFRSLPRLRPLSTGSIASGVLGFCFLAALASTLETRVFTGLWQRLLVSVLFAWTAVVGLHLFREGRAE